MLLESEAVDDEVCSVKGADIAGLPGDVGVGVGDVRGNERLCEDVGCGVGKAPYAQETSVCRAI